MNKQNNILTCTLPNIPEAVGYTFYKEIKDETIRIYYVDIRKLDDFKLTVLMAKFRK